MSTEFTLPTQEELRELGFEPDDIDPEIFATYMASFRDAVEEGPVKDFPEFVKEASKAGRERFNAAKAVTGNHGFPPLQSWLELDKEIIDLSHEKWFLLFCGEDSEGFEFLKLEDRKHYVQAAKRWGLNLRRCDLADGIPLAFLLDWHLDSAARLY